MSQTMYKQFEKDFGKMLIKLASKTSKKSGMPRKEIFVGLSMNANITWELVQENPKLSWSYRHMSENANITWEMIRANPRRQWNYKSLSGNSIITWQIVQENPQIPWDYTELSLNPNITWDIVQAHPNEEWDYDSLSENPNITLGNSSSKSRQNLEFFNIEFQ